MSCSPGQGVLHFEGPVPILHSHIPNFHDVHCTCTVHMLFAYLISVHSTEQTVCYIVWFHSVVNIIFIVSTEKNQTTQSKSLTISQTTILFCFFCITLGIFHLKGPFRVIFDLSVNIHPCMCACYRPSRGMSHNTLSEFVLCYLTILMNRTKMKKPQKNYYNQLLRIERTLPEVFHVEILQQIDHVKPRLTFLHFMR